MSEEVAIVKEQGVHSDRNQSKNDSLLSILHDKNKIIEKLQRQLHFQKLQLKYYLGKTFKNEKVLDFSNNCNPSLMEDNIPITFAVNRFYVQLGIKSKLFVLYERMYRIDGRINNLLRIQEGLLRIAVVNMCEIAKKEKGMKFQIQIENMILKPEYMHLFNNILNASIGLKKNLDTFRICCDRLLLIEEERNSIAEQVYSLPIEQRTSCHYLIGIQIERVQLENRLKEILKDQCVLRKKIEQLSEIEGELKTLQSEYRRANKHCTEHMTDMLRKINMEALGLITKSKKQKERYTNEIVKLKCENQRILKIVEKLKTCVKKKLQSEESMKMDSLFSAGLYQALDQEINQAIRDNEMNKDSRIEKIRMECRELSKKLNQARKEKNLVEKELENVKSEYNEARRQWESNLEAVQQERNEYKTQVEDLQAIRAAYAQLVDSRANMTEGEKICTSPKNKDFEKENLELKKEIAILKEETNKQKTKIRRLSEQILCFNSNNQKILEIDNLETKDVGSGDVGEDLPLPKRNSCNICFNKSEMEKDIILQELQRSNVSQDDIRNLVENEKLDQITTYIIQDLTNNLNECRCERYLNETMDYSGNNQESTYSTETKINVTPERSSVDADAINFQVSNTNDETTLKIQSDGDVDEEELNCNTGKERDVNDIGKIGENSLVSVEVRYISSRRYPTSPNSDQIDSLEESVDLKSQNFSSGIMDTKITSREEMAEFRTSSLEKDEVKALKLTYKNPHEYGCLTDSDPAFEPQSSVHENCCNMSVKKIKMRLRAVVDQEDENLKFSRDENSFEKRGKSLGDLRS